MCRCRPALAALALLFALLSPVFAQAPPAYPGTTTAIGGVFTRDIYDGIYGPGVSGTAPGWNLTYNGRTHGLTVTVPANAPRGDYTTAHVTGGTGSGDFYVSYGYQAYFRVVDPPPTKPLPGSPAFSWQGSVAGVNTGNGNKTTTLPIVGWTQRGGMAVSCTLFHNSQTPMYGSYGAKWLPSYFTYLTVDGSGNETLHWDNGLTYPFTKNGTVYAPPYGILDTLVSTGNGTFTLTTPGKIVYTFGFAPGNGNPNAYLSKITDLDGNILTINHRADTLITNIVDATNRTLTFAYDGNNRLSTLTDPLGRVFAFFYSPAGDLSQVNTPSLNGQFYAAAQIGYDGRHDISSLTNTRGYASTFYCDAADRLIWARDPKGNQTTFAYNPTTTVITDPNGHTIVHTYTASRLSSVTDAANNTESNTYDYNNILTQKTDRQNHKWVYSSHFSNGSTSSVSTDPLRVCIKSH